MSLTESQPVWCHHLPCVCVCLCVCVCTLLINTTRLRLSTVTAEIMLCYIKFCLSRLEIRTLLPVLRKKLFCDLPLKGATQGGGTSQELRVDPSHTSSMRQAHGLTTARKWNATNDCKELTAAFSHSRAPRWEGTPANTLTSTTTDAGQTVQLSSTQAPDPKKWWDEIPVPMNRTLEF